MASTPTHRPSLQSAWRSTLPSGSIPELPRTPVLQASHCLWPGRSTCGLCPEQAKHVRTGSGWWWGDLPGM